MKKVFREKLYNGLVQEIKIKKLLVSKKSKFQHIDIFDSESYGRVLALDGVVQMTEKDEFAYSEMLVHPLFQTSKKPPKNILIIGGGDGAVAEEVLKYKFVRNVDLVDIDKEVVDLSKKYFKKINNNSLIHKKIKIFYADAFCFIKKSKKKYDVVIADRPDPIGAGKSLFKNEFYKNIKYIMSSNSIAVFQSGVPFLQKKELNEIVKDVKKTFKYSGFFLTVVPSYIGGFMALVWASDNNNFNKIKKLKKFKLKTEYFNESIYISSHSIPNFIKK